MSPKVCERCNVSKISGSQQIGSVECEECEIWICRKCEELSDDDLKLISNTKKIARLTYKCKLCVEKQQQQTVQLTELTKKIDELEANQADSVVKMQENKEKIKKQDKDMKATQIEMKKYMDQLEKKPEDEASMRMANVIMVERVDEFKKVIQTLELIVSEQKKELVT